MDVVDQLGLLLVSRWRAQKAKKTASPESDVESTVAMARKLRVAHERAAVARAFKLTNRRRRG